MDEDFWAGFSDEDDSGFDALSSLLENETVTPISTSHPTNRKREASSMSCDQDQEMVDTKRRCERDEDGVTKMKAKMIEMEKELDLLKKRLNEKEKNVQKEVTTFKGKRIARQIKSPVPEEKIKVGVAKTEVQDDDTDCEKDMFSGIRIKNPLISSELMCERMKGRKFLKIPQISLRVKDGDIEGDWVTVGVIVSKLAPRDTAKGKKFSVWRLSDLSSQSACISFFLFDKVFQEHWKIPVGHVIGLLNSNIQTNKETNYSTGVSGTNRYSLSIDNPSKLMPMGISKDFITCRATTKNGKPCQNYANKQHGGYCDYHIQGEYNKVRSKRMDCQGGYGPNTHNLQQKLLGQADVFYQGKWFKGGGGGTGGGKGGGGGGAGGGKGGRLFACGIKDDISEVENILSNEKKGIKKLYKDEMSLQRGNEVFKHLLQGQTPGARCMKTHLKKEDSSSNKSESRDKSALEFLQEHSLKIHQTLPEVTQKSQTLGKVTEKSQTLPKVTQKSQTLGKVTEKSQTTKSRLPMLSKPKDFELFAPDNLKPIKMTLEEETTVDKKRDITPRKRTSSARELSTVKNHTHFQPAPAPLTKTSCAVNKLTSECKAKEQALLVIQRRGPLTQQDLNKRGKTLTDKQVMNVKLRVEKSISSTEDIHVAPVKKRSRSINPNEFERVLNAKSSHQWAVNEDERSKEESYFQNLEKKEIMEERLSQIKELSVRVIQCKECDYVSEFMGERCRKEGHSISRTKATKRCFKCSVCGLRIFTYNERYPIRSCQCGENKFKSTSLYKERTGPKLPSEELSLRGYEQKFLNSLN